MAKDPQQGASPQSQAPQASGGIEKTDKGDQIQHFESTIAKMVERKDEETGKTEWVEVLSDNLYPGEKLKRDYDDERTEKAEKKLAKKHEDDERK